MEDSNSSHSHSHCSISDNVSAHVSSSTEHVTDGGSFGGGTGSSNGAKYRLMSPAKLPISRSSCITIPPGLSPTSFLESPVLLSNIKAEPSPTTGSLFKASLMRNSSEAVALSSGETNNERASDSFEFKLHTESSSASRLPSLAIPSGSSRNGPVNLNEARFLQSPLPLSVEARERTSSKELQPSVPMNTHDSSVCSLSDEPNQGGNSHSGVLVTSSDQRESISSLTTDRTSDDGFNWRKYGQKLVKGSEFPRSYYKCTYPNCEVKKIFERSPSGQITEIVYKGSHDHPKPQLARRHNPCALVPIQEEKWDRDLPFSGQEDKFHSNNIEPNVSPALSPLQANEEGLDGSGSQYQGVNEDIDAEDPFSKRRKMEDGLDITPVVKPIREPRVVVQTVSEVDILDDGYRWRKYGQKVVRGNPNPRSYYKCTYVGCPVRKHVERASHDPKAVITTYEGKHNHDVPTAKNSNHEFAGTVPLYGTSKPRQEENTSSISLDLGVGRTNEQTHSMDADGTGSQIIPNNNFSMMVGRGSQISSSYGFVNGGLSLYGNRENRVDGHSFQTPPVHPSTQCPQNLGRILMGP